MIRDSRVGELRAWNLNAGRIGSFLIVGIEGFRVDVILSGGERDGFLKSYLERNSEVISAAHGRAA
jgi:hypothetical protein